MVISGAIRSCPSFNNDVMVTENNVVVTIEMVITITAVSAIKTNRDGNCNRSGKKMPGVVLEVNVVKAIELVITIEVVAAIMR